MRISNRWWLLACLATVACGANSSPDANFSLTTVVDAGSACSNGGVVVETGIDTNGDGVLEVVEITAAHTICNGTNGGRGDDGRNGHDALVSTTILATGDSHCPFGGTEIDTGLDNGDGGGTADDGVLKPGEIDSTQYVCGGNSSSSGGHNSLVNTVALSVGDSHCPSGGTEIESGVDDGSGGGTADDGVLQAGEITSTQYVCDGSSPNTSHNSLVSTSSLSIGDLHCAAGGTEIDSGLDNGAGGGTADDGILQSGEITATKYVCSGISTPSQLVSVTTLAIGDSNCAFGGTLISTGLDINDDGTLQGTEVTSNSYVCNSAPSSLINTTTLPSGDSHCANGGTQIDTGLDNGAGGGIAGDGVLQAGEVTSTQYVCGGGGGATQQTFTIDARGGAAVSEGGGNGGSVTLEISTGTGGAASILNTGTVNTNFSLPIATFDAGPAALIVSSDTTTLNLYNDVNGGLISGDAYFQVRSDSNLYANIGGDATVVTGIDVAAGATLHLQANDNNNYGALVVVSGDVHNGGTIECGAGVLEPAIDLTANNFIGDVGSIVTLAGNGPGGNFSLRVLGVFVNQGTINTFGEDGFFGSPGGNVQIVGGSGVYNAGTIDAHGGSSNSPAGEGQAEGFSSKLAIAMVTFAARLQSMSPVATLTIRAMA